MPLYLTCVKSNWPINNLRSESEHRYSNHTRTIAGSPLSRLPPSYSRANLGITHTESLFAGYYMYVCRATASVGIFHFESWNITLAYITVKTGQAFLSRVDLFNNFIIANLISGIISIIWLLDEWCKIQIKPEFKTRILIGYCSRLVPGWREKLTGVPNLHNLPRSLTSVICLSF